MLSSSFLPLSVIHLSCRCVPNIALVIRSMPALLLGCRKFSCLRLDEVALRAFQINWSSLDSRHWKARVGANQITALRELLGNGSHREKWQDYLISSCLMMCVAQRHFRLLCSSSQALQLSAMHLPGRAFPLQLLLFYHCPFPCCAAKRPHACPLMNSPPWRVQISSLELCGRSCYLACVLPLVIWASRWHPQCAGLGHSGPGAAHPEPPPDPSLGRPSFRWRCSASSCRRLDGCSRLPTRNHPLREYSRSQARSSRRRARRRANSVEPLGTAENSSEPSRTP